MERIRIRHERDLEKLLSTPSPELIKHFRTMQGDILVLGVGGKIGPTLAMTAVRAAAEARAGTRVLGVSRFSEAGLADRLREGGVVPIACDLLDETEVARLPNAENVVFMAGRKFGTTGSEGLTWAMNALVPANVARRFRESRIVVFSTGCVYPLVPPDGGGCSEERAPDPVGEYAASCLARERIFTYYAALYGTRVTILRLNYAIDLRYGVLHDIALRIRQGLPVSLAVPVVNVIWQGDVNTRALLSLAHCENPPRVLNLTGPDVLSVRSLALELGELLGKQVQFEGEEGKLALLSDSSRAVELFGHPSVGLRTMMEWTARWVASGGRSLGRPTHFEVSDGRY